VTHVDAKASPAAKALLEQESYSKLGKKKKKDPGGTDKLKKKEKIFGILNFPRRKIEESLRGWSQGGVERTAQKGCIKA